jgi:Uma2 family endonuclease
MASTTATTPLIPPDSAMPDAPAPSPAEIASARIRALVPEQRVVLRGIGWDGFEAILKIIGAQPAVRLAYDRGDLELMATSQDHELFKTLLGRMVETIGQELRIPCKGVGSMTWRKQVADRGIEPDDCFYIASFPLIRGKKDINLDVDPPPDLAIEVEISRSLLDRLGIYAALRVPEIWRADGETVRIEQLQANGTYARVDTSLSFPFLRAEEIVEWLRRAEEIEDHSEWGYQFSQWVRTELAPRLGERGNTDRS